MCDLEHDGAICIPLTHPSPPFSPLPHPLTPSKPLSSSHTPFSPLTHAWRRCVISSTMELFVSQKGFLDSLVFVLNKHSISQHVVEQGVFMCYIHPSHHQSISPSQSPLSHPISLSISLSIHSSICLSPSQSPSLSINLSIDLSLSISLSLSITQSIDLSIYRFFWLLFLLSRRARYRLLNTLSTHTLWTSLLNNFTTYECSGVAGRHLLPDPSQETLHS